MILCASVQAAQVQISWQLPTEREDGTQLTAEEIKYFKFYALPPSAQDDVFVSQEEWKTESAVDTFTFDLGVIQSGSWCFYIVTVDVSNQESQPSERVCKDILAAPKAPTIINVKVTVSGDPKVSLEVDMSPEADAEVEQANDEAQ